VRGAGFVTAWDGRRWLVDERDEEQLKEEAKERFRKRMAGDAGSSPTNSTDQNAGNASVGLVCVCILLVLLLCVFACQ